MTMRRKLLAFSLATLAIASLDGCRTRHVRNRMDESGLPLIILWAWERPENLEFIDPHQVGVAFLAQTLVLKGDEVVLNPRHQPLKVSPETKLIAVTRVESQKTTGEKAALSPSQRERVATLVLRTLELSNVSVIQVDYDAASSEREFYRALLQDLRSQLPDRVPLSMTALASFCVGDRWLDDLPVDEAVPMIFRMGADDKTIKNLLASGDDFREPLCRKSYGIAVDEPLEAQFNKSRRIYVFNNHSWSEKDVASLQERMRQ